MAYCCRDFAVSRLLTNRLALLCYDSWTSTIHVSILFFQIANRSWVLIGFIDQDGPVHGVGGFAKFSPLRPLSD